jgi:hypothetical protein
MTLPYPYEIETDTLRPRRDPAPQSSSIEERARDLVAVEGRRLVIAGCELRVPPNKNAEAYAARLQDTITQRFLERRPNADEATWSRYLRRLQGQLASRSTIDSRTIREIVLLIDGL